MRDIYIDKKKYVDSDATNKSCLNLLCIYIYIYKLHFRVQAQFKHAPCLLSLLTI